MLLCYAGLFFLDRHELLQNKEAYNSALRAAPVYLTNRLTQSDVVP